MATTSTKSTGPKGRNAETDAIALLTADHKTVKGLFKQFEQLTKQEDVDDEKAAIVLFSRGPDRAETLFKRLDESEHRRFAHAFNRLKEVSTEQVTEVLAEFTHAIAESRALRGGASEVREFLLKVLEPG